jgi:hypothetical protein
MTRTKAGATVTGRNEKGIGKERRRKRHQIRRGTATDEGPRNIRKLARQIKILGERNIGSSAQIENIP